MRHVAWLLACAFAVPVLAQAPGPKPAPAVVAGLSSERLARIAPVVEQFVRDGQFPGVSVTVARHGRVAFQREFGFADLAKKTPLRRDAIYRVFSMSKPVTGVAVMMLFEEGRFLLDDPVSKYLPCFKDLQVFESETPAGPKLVKADREVTIRDLLRHTSGFGYGGSADPVARMYQAKNVMDPNSTLEQMVEKACSVPLRFQPGTKWEYSIAMDLLGRLVEVVSGQPLDVFMQKRIFDPLKMVDTGFYVPEAKAGRFANCYSYTPGKGLSPLPPAGAIDRYTRGRNKLLSGGGGLVSTAADYLRFATMLLRGGELDGVRLLGPRTVGLMSMNQLPQGVKPAWWGGKNGGNGYGFTMSVTTDVAETTGYGSVGDFGWDGAALTFFRIDPKEDLVVLVMTQRMPTDLEIQVKVKTLVYQALVDAVPAGR
jgi:CubicO group peptidase (beta-lactamase class C family)